ncbi:MAG: hypothetical protein AN484_28480 [Aphanizomenon flos-aquae WA102]|uniref:Uncharacterized protein n=1 Tax=Aphanizomenon flos-aquae WA102 TaxID=1710896 RepID=A0A1B7W481_APHFL|nr:MAG: hypothetical protein AN484_28480 [Aphanizomenon flos-aquae WA102]
MTEMVEVGRGCRGERATISTTTPTSTKLVRVTRRLRGGGCMRNVLGQRGGQLDVWGGPKGHLSGQQKGGWWQHEPGGP